jgi:hypothetical protein
MDNMRNFSNNKNNPAPARRNRTLGFLLLSVGLAFFTTILGYLIFRLMISEETDRLFLIYSIGVVCTCLTIFIIGLFLSRENQNILVLFLASIGISFYLVEIVLELSPKTTRAEIARGLGIDFDERTKIEVTEELRSEGYNVSVRMPSLLLSEGLETGRGRIFPIGNISNSLVVYCNEGGEWSLIQSDSRGFISRSASYDQRRVNVILVGDSFAEGACVRYDDTVTGILDTNGWLPISLGRGGHGPLRTYVSLREYALTLKPRYVLWLYFEGSDMSDLYWKEEGNELLNRYLTDPDYTQNLFFRQVEIDRALLEVQQSAVTQAKKMAEKKEDNFLPFNSVWRVIRMMNLSHILLGNLTNKNRHIPNETLITFDLIMRETKTMVDQWNGNFVFVYLPSFYRYSNIFKRWRYPENRRFKEQIQEILRAYGITIIDIAETFGKHHDPLSLFPLRTRGHYTPEGYRLISEEILSSIGTP